MRKYRLLPILFITILIFQGCGATADKLMDKSDSMMLNNISKKIGTSYSKYTSGAVGKLSYGKAQVTKNLSDGSVFYLHVKGSGVSGWSVLGLIGRVSKRYSIYGFKVKDGNIEDAAYGAFLPDYQGWKLGFITIYNDEGMIDEIKDRYGEFLKTSKGQNVSSWE